MQNLYTAFQFDRADIEANRQGELSARQKRRLSREATPPLPIDSIRNVSILFIGIAVIIGLLTSDAILPVLFGTIGLFGVIFWGIEETRTRQYRRIGIEVAQGIARIGQRTTTSHDFRAEEITTLTIGHRSFPIDDFQARNIDEGEVYTVYYAGEVLLSLELAFDLPNQMPLDEIAYYESEKQDYL